MTGVTSGGIVQELGTRRTDSTAIPGARLRSGGIAIEELAATVVAPPAPQDVVPDLAHDAGTPRAAAPAVLVDPRPESLLVARSLRARGVPVLVLSARRLEPVLFARGVKRQRLPSLMHQPERWQAALLELAARLEPRPLLFGCSDAGLEFLRATRPRLAPHFVHANTQTLYRPNGDAVPSDADAALRRATARGEAALEVQVVRDGRGRRIGSCVLLWAPGAAPDLAVTSVAGHEVAARTEALLQASEWVGYLRAIWAPDRFGRLELQAASALPGPGLAMAHDDGIDLAALAYAAAADRAVPVQHARQQLVRRLAMQEPGLAGDATPLVALPPRLVRRDPLPWFAACLRGLARS
jgi:hypothetical protein